MTTLLHDNESTVAITIGSHEFIPKYLKKPTWCGICNEFIIGVTSAQQDAYKCSTCKLVGHHHCLESANKECLKKKVEFSEVTNEAMKTYLGSSAQKAGQVEYTIEPILKIFLPFLLNTELATGESIRNHGRTWSRSVRKSLFSSRCIQGQIRHEIVPTSL
jgi:hypothetical protein